MPTAIARFSFTLLAIACFAIAFASGPGKPAPQLLIGSASAGTAAAGTLETATFAAGCYWCVESDFDKVEGVVETISGFMGGHVKNPTYEQVGHEDTGHAEVVQLRYDPAKVTYQKLLDYYWRHVDFTDGGGQFCDRGSSYRPVIFTHSAEQKALAEASKSALETSGRFNRPVAVKIEPASDFYPGPDYHQDYYKKNPVRYRIYRAGCGRDARLQGLWGAEASH